MIYRSPPKASAGTVAVAGAAAEGAAEGGPEMLCRIKI
jgi:hypothetical protein